MACNSMSQKAQQVQLTLFPPTYFDMVMADGRWERNYPHLYFFPNRKVLFVDMKLGTHAK